MKNTILERIFRDEEMNTLINGISNLKDILQEEIIKELNTLNYNLKILSL